MKYKKQIYRMMVGSSILISGYSVAHASLLREDLEVPVEVPTDALDTALEKTFEGDPIYEKQYSHPSGQYSFRADSKTHHVLPRISLDQPGVIHIEDDKNQ